MAEGGIGGPTLVGVARLLARLVRPLAILAAHYGDAPNDFVLADNVELPWPSARGRMEWECRVVSLRYIFPEHLLALCVPDRELGAEEDLGAWPDGEGGALCPVGP